MKIALFEMPEGMNRDQLLLRPELWGELKKIGTMEAGGKRRATGLQISRAVWDMVEAPYRYADRWNRLVYRASVDKVLAAVCFLDDPDQWKRFTPSVGNIYKRRNEDGTADHFAIMWCSRTLKGWHVSTWDKDTLSWGHSSHSYPGTLGPWEWAGGFDEGQVFCTENMGSYRFVQRTNNHKEPMVDYLNRYDLPLLHWKDEHLRTQIAQELAKTNGPLWLGQGFCPFCANEQDTLSELTQDLGEERACPNCKRLVSELAEAVGLEAIECHYCGGCGHHGHDFDGMRGCDECGARGYHIENQNCPTCGHPMCISPVGNNRYCPNNCHKNKELQP